MLDLGKLSSITERLSKKFVITSIVQITLAVIKIKVFFEIDIRIIDMKGHMFIVKYNKLNSNNLFKKLILKLFKYIKERFVPIIFLIIHILNLFIKGCCIFEWLRNMGKI